MQTSLRSYAIVVIAVDTIIIAVRLARRAVGDCCAMFNMARGRDRTL